MFIVKMEANILNTRALANGYTALLLESDCFLTIKPGHYFILNDSLASYASKKAPNQAEFIIPPSAPLSFTHKTICLSSFKGNALPSPSEKFTALISEEDSLNACLFYLKTYRHLFKGIVFIGTSTAFPFYPCPSRIIIPGLPSAVIAALPLLEDWGMANRLANTNETPGCFVGTAGELARLWLEKTNRENIDYLTLPRLASL